MVGISLNSFYSRIYCQASSTEEALLSVGNSEGKLAIFNIANVISGSTSNGEGKLQSPINYVNAHNDSVYSMASSREFCISGATGIISGWKWRELKKGNTKASWNIPLDCDQANFGTPEVNSLAYDSSRNLVYAACGDWKTRIYDIETRKETAALEGHEDYVHDVVISGNQVISAGEDGQVLLWDPRVGRDPKVKLKPYTNPQIARPNIGKFISSVDVDNDWLICGGGPKAAIFHLRSLAFTTALSPIDASIHVTKFTKQGLDRGSIAYAGSKSSVHISNISGEVSSEIQTSASCIYSLNIINEPKLLMTLGGTGPKLDVCTNLLYRNHSVLMA